MIVQHDITPGVSVWPLIAAANKANEGLSLRLTPLVTYNQAADMAEDLRGNLAGPLTLEIPGTGRETVFAVFRRWYATRPDGLVFATPPAPTAPVADPVATGDRRAILDVAADIGKALDDLAAGKG